LVEKYSIINWILVIATEHYQKFLSLWKDADPSISEVSLALETHWGCEDEAGWVEGWVIAS
jgi:hypothetical protein